MQKPAKQNTKLAKNISRHSAAERLVAVKLILEQKSSVTKVAKYFGVSRKTSYQWINKYQANRLIGLRGEEAIDYGYVSGKNHHNAKYPWLEEIVLKNVGDKPERTIRDLAKISSVSVSTLWKILHKNNLSLPEERVAYAYQINQKHQKAIKPFKNLDIFANFGRLIRQFSDEIVSGIEYIYSHIIRVGIIGIGGGMTFTIGLLIAGQISNQPITVATILEPTKIIKEQPAQEVVNEEVRNVTTQEVAVIDSSSQEDLPIAKKIENIPPANAEVNLPEIEIKTDANSFQVNQESKFTIAYKDDSLIDKINRKASQVLGSSTDPGLAENVEIAVSDTQGIPVPDDLVKIESNGSDALDVSINTKSDFKPGKYHLQIKYGGQTFDQDFSWGVLAMNLNKPIYKPDETARVSIGVLDEAGMMVCDAKVSVEVLNGEKIVATYSTDDGSVIVNKECKVKDFTLNPDYEFSHQVGKAGEYQIKLTSETKNGSFTIIDNFAVEENPDFEIERETATRIYPPHVYPVKMYVTPKVDFKGEIQETVPSAFNLDESQIMPQPSSVEEKEGRKIITWQADWKAGQKYELSYEYKAPNISPYFYLLGPMDFYDTHSNDSRTTDSQTTYQPIFSENRQWQIASDDIGDFGSVWYMRTVTADTAFGTAGPSAEYSSVTETQAGPSDRTTALAMTTEIEGSTHTGVTQEETSTTNPTYQWFRTFLSPKLAAQTLTSGATFRVELGNYESAASQNTTTQVHVYQWRQGTGYVATLFDGASGDIDCGKEPDGGVNVRNQTCITSATGSNVSFQAGDQIAVEIWMRSANTVAGSRTSGIYYGGNQFIGAGIVNDSVSLSSAMSSFAVSQSLVLQTDTAKGSNWFLRSTTANSAFGTTGPTAEGSSVTDYDSSSPTNKTTALSMTDEAGTSVASVAGTESDTTNPKYQWMRTYLSPKFAAQTIPTGTTFRLETGLSESNSASNVSLQVNIFRWRESDSSRVNILDNAGANQNCGIEPDGSLNNARNQTCVTDGTSGDVVLVDGDQIGVEYFINYTNNASQSQTGTIYFEGNSFIEQGVLNDNYTNSSAMSMFSINKTLNYLSSSIEVSGIAYESNGSTIWSGCDSSTQRLSLVVNGGTAVTTSCNSTTGAYTFTGVTVAANNPVSVFFNTNGSNTEKGVAVTVASDASSDISLSVNQDYVKIDTETGVSNITNTNLGHCNSSTPAGCANVPYAVSGSNLTLVSGTTLRVNTSTVFAPGGNVTTQGTTGHLHIDDNATYTGSSTQSITVGGDVSIDSGSTFTAPTSGTITLGGSWTNAGTFTAGSSVVTFNSGASGKNIISGGDEFSGLTFNNSAGGWTILDDLTVLGDFNITAGTFNAGTNLTIILKGTDGTPFSNSGTFNAGTSTVSYESTINSTIAVVTYYKLKTNPASGTPTFTIPNNLTVSDNLTLAGAGSAILDADANDAEVSVGGDMIIGTGHTFSASNLSTTTLAGSLTQNGTFDHNSGSVIFNSASSETLSGSASVTLNHATFTGGGSWVLPDNISFGNLIVTSGTVVAPAGSMEVRGNFTNNSTFDANDGTITFTSAGSSTISGTLTGSSSLHNLIFSNASGSWSINATTTLTGSFTITTATAVTAPSASNLTVAGNFIGGSSFNPNGGTVILNGAATSTQEISGTTSFYNLSATTTASRSLEFASSTTYTIDNNLTLESNACGAELNLVSSIPGTSYTITVDAGTVVVMNYLTIKDLTASYAMTANHSQNLGGNSNITINSGNCSATSSSTNATGYSFQRKTFTDVTNSIDWLFFYDGNRIKYNFTSDDGATWANGGSLDYNTNDFSVWNKNIGGTEYVWLAVAVNNDVVLRRGTLSSSSITWDTASPVVTAFDGNGISNTYAHPYISLDSSSYIWVLTRYYDGTNYVIKTVRSTNVANTTWTAVAFVFNVSAQISDNQTDDNVFGNIVPLASQGMYATFVANTALEGCTFDTSGGSWEDSSGAGCEVTEEIGGGGESEYFDSLDNGLIAYWKMNEASWSGVTGEVIDTTTSNYDGTAQGGATTAKAGFDHSGTFAGDNDFVNAGDVTELNSASAFSVSQWAYITDVSAKDRIFYKIKNGDDDISIAPYYQGGQKLYFEVGNGANSYGYVDTTGIISNNNWYHIVAVFNGSGSTNDDKMQVYINGVRRTLDFAGTTIPSSTANLSGRDLTIGKGDTNYFTGNLDDVRIYDRAITGEEVSKLYQIVPESVNTDDASDFGSLTGSGRQTVRTSTGVLYSFINDGGNCEMWKSINGVSWQITDSETCDNLAPVAIAIDKNNDIHALYSDTVASNIIEWSEYSTSTDTFGTSETVQSDITSDALNQLSITIDNADAPHVAFSMVDNSTPYYFLKYRNRTGGSWQTTRTLETLVSGDPQFDVVDITINEDNIPELAYVNTKDNDLTIAVGNVNNASSFTLQDVDADINDTNGQRGVSIAINYHTGDTWVAYVDSDNDITLAKHADADGWGTWTTITTKTDDGYEPSISVDGANNVYVFYENVTDDIAYDIYDSIAGNWAGETILHTGTFQDVKVKSSFETDNFGPNKIDYLYSDGTDVFYNQLYLRRDPTNIDNASDFSSPGSNNSMNRQVVRTSTGVLYSVLNDYGSCEVWKSTDNGNNWIEMDSSNNPTCDSVSNISVAIDSLDTLHIAYPYYDTGSKIKHTVFSSITDTFGSTSNAVALPYMNPQVSIAIDSNDFPHIAFVETNASATNSIPRYTNLINGWDSTPVTLETISSGNISGIELVISKDNVPIINYANFQDSDLTIAVGNSSNATSFTLYDIDSDINSVSGTSRSSMVIDSSGNAWVAYVDNTSPADYVSLIKHNYADSWTTWQTTLTNSNVGNLPSLNLFNNDVVVFYEDDQNHIVYDMYDGASWNGETALEIHGSLKSINSSWSYINNFDSSGVAPVQTRTYYFDGSDNSTPGTPDDPDSHWTSDASGFDDSTSTYAEATTDPGDTGSESNYYLHGQGTSAPNLTSTIVSVKARLMASSNNDVTAKIYSDSLAQTLGTLTKGGSVSWSDYLTLDTPSGGWTWSKIQSLETKVYTVHVSGAPSRYYKLEILVQSTNNTTTPKETDYLYSDGTDIFYNRLALPELITSPGTQDAIDTVPSDLARNISSVVDSSGNVHLAYFKDDSGVIKPAYKKRTGSTWDGSATLLDTTTGWNASLSIDTATNDLYYLWQDGAGGINYRQYDLSATSWLTEVAWKDLASSVANVVSNYSGANRIFGAWTEGSSSPYSANWDLILGEPPDPTLQVLNTVLNSEDAISLTEGDVTTISWTATVTDTDGYADISSATGKVYRSGVTNAENCVTNNSNCYADASCSLSSCAGNSCTATCSADIYFYAQPTDAGSPYSSQYWLGYVSATDSQSETASDISASALTDLETMSAMDITASINYGAIAVGDDSGTDNEIVAITNTGNTTLDVDVSGDNMCTDYPTCAGNVITVGYQEFSTSAFTYSLGTMLTGTPQLVSLNLAKSYSIPALSTANLYWGMGIPSLTPSGNYQGEQTITAVSSD